MSNFRPGFTRLIPICLLILINLVIGFVVVRDYGGTRVEQLLK